MLTALRSPPRAQHSRSDETLTELEWRMKLAALDFWVQRRCDFLHLSVNSLSPGQGENDAHFSGRRERVLCQRAFSCAIHKFRGRLHRAKRATPCWMH
jgi:hypothetical protein